MKGLKVIVLGASAGGGSPQWNCNSPVSRQLRQRNQWRTQSSIAVSANGQDWFLFNASPDISYQIRATQALHPSDGIRHSPIKGVVLTNGDVDHIAGLLSLRESHPLALYATSRVDGVIRDNKIFQVLNPKFVQRRPLSLSRDLILEDANGKSCGIVIEPFAVPGKVALWLEDESKGSNFGTVEEDTIALKVSLQSDSGQKDSGQSDSGQKDSGQSDSGQKDSGQSDPDCSFYYIPACAGMTDDLRRRLQGAGLVFFDGTLWRNDEMVKVKAGVKTGTRMGHMNNSGKNGSVMAFQDLEVKRKIFIHINTTNPILLEDSPERHEVEDAGWEVSYDGMEVTV